MRVAQEVALGRPQPDPGQRVGDPGLLVAGHAVHPQPLGHRLVDGVPRVQRAGRVLQHELHLAAVGLQRPRRRSAAARRRRATWPADGRSSPSRVRASVVLPQPDSPTSATISPRPSCEVDAVDGPRRLPAAGPEGRRTARPPRATGPPDVTAATSEPTCTQAAACPGPAGRSRTSSVRQRVDGLRAARVERAAGGQVAGPRRVARQAAAARTGPPGRRSSGTRPTAPGCTGAGRGRAPRADGPSSTTRPAYITASRSQVVPSTDRSWLITSRPSAEVADQRGEQVQHLRLHHHVQRRGRLVGDDQPRAAGQRHRDHHALLLAAGELVRVRRRQPRRQPHLAEQLARPGRPRRARWRPGRAAASARRSAGRCAAPG